MVEPPRPPALERGRSARKIIGRFSSNSRSLRGTPLFVNHDCENHAEAARKPSAGVARVQAPSPAPSTPAASPPIPPSRPPWSSSAIASIFVTKSESNHSFQPGYMHSKAGSLLGRPGGSVRRQARGARREQLGRATLTACWLTNCKFSTLRKWHPVSRFVPRGRRMPRVRSELTAGRGPICHVCF